MRDYVLILIVFIVGFVAVRKPVFGMLAFVCFAFLNPQSFTWGIGQTFPIAMITAVGTIIGYVLWTEQKKIPIQLESAILAALWIMIAVSTAFAVEPMEALEHFIYISKIFVMVFLSTAILNTPSRIQWLLRVIGMSLGIFAIVDIRAATITEDVLMESPVR